MKLKDTLIWNDIQEIPLLLKNFSERACELKASALKSSDNSVYLVGRGSSGNATLFAKYIWETYCGVTTNIVHPHSIFEARIPLNFKNKVVWAFSQSGKSPDIIKCTKILKEWGAKTVAVTNEVNLKKNFLAKITDKHILLSDSREITVAATKSFILQLWVILWSAQIWSDCFKKNNFTEIILLFKNFLLAESFRNLFKLVEKLKKVSMIGFVGRGPYNAVAEDAALKFREISSTHAIGYSAAEFMHGPIGAFSGKDFVFILSKNKNITEDLQNVQKSLKARKTPYYILYPYEGVFPFNCLITDACLKILSIELALEKGLNPDNPEGLTKITPTM